MRAKVSKLVMDGYGSYLGMERGCFTLRDKKGEVERYPLFENELGEVVLRSGNMVSTGALASLGFWGVDVVVLTQRGRPVAVLKSLDDDSHVKTRIGQYEALLNGKGVHIAKQLVLSRIESQDILLMRHSLETHSFMLKRKVEGLKAKNLAVLRRRLLAVEAKATKHYFGQIFTLFPKKLRVRTRKAFRAYDGVNNAFNLVYELLSWKCHRALLKARLEPYLGFLHSLQFGKPSLVCDFMELYRSLIDGFLIGFLQRVRASDFVIKSEDVSRKRRGKREYLNRVKTRELIRGVYGLFDSWVEVPRIKWGDKQSVETLINEEALLLAKYFRGERELWVPRVVG